MSTESQYIEVKHEGDISIVRVTEVDALSESFEEVADELLSVVENENCRKLIIDLGNVQYLHSMALGQLVKLEKSLIAVGGQLRLCNLQPTVKELFEITGLDSVLDIRQDETAAKSGF